MARSPHLRRLRKLNISNAADGPDGQKMDLQTARALGQSPNLAQLEELDLGMTSFSLKVWNEVLGWPWLSRLKWLRLHYARQVNPPSRLTVAELQNLPNYRSSFEKLVANVDWRTEFISPWDDDTCWRGLSWRDRPRNLLFDMNRFVQAQDYATLEAEYRKVCIKLSGEQVAKEIDGFPFDRYEKELQNGLKQALARIESTKARALFLRLRPDIRWEGEFHVQAKDPEIDTPCEEFGYESPFMKVAGPGFEEAAALYAQKPLYSGTSVSGSALYLLARTVAAFGRSLGELSPAVPIYFSFMYAVFRMKDGGRIRRE